MGGAATPLPSPNNDSATYRLKHLDEMGVFVQCDHPMGIAAVILLVISGVAGVVLTVWGRVMPPETSATRRGFVAVGGLSVICIVAAGILNAASQNSLKRTIEMVSANIQKLAAPANVRRDLSVDDILAAAASKLRQQDVQIQQLQSQIKDIKHPKDALYLGDKIVAKTLGTVRQVNSDIVFQLVVAAGNGLDFSQDFHYQNLTLKCRSSGITGSTGSFGVRDTRYPNLQCQIIK